MTELVLSEGELEAEISETTVNDELNDVQIDEQLITYPAEEIKQIKQVMQKDKELREIDSERTKKLEIEFNSSMLNYKMTDIGSSDTYCSICSEKFSLIMNKRKMCLFCENGVCGNCLYTFYHNSVQVCKLCFEQSIRDGKSGFWFNSQSETNGRLRRSASVIIISSIRRIRSKLPRNQHKEKQSFNIPVNKNEYSINEPYQRSATPIKNSPKAPRRSYVEAIDNQSSKKTIDNVDSAMARLEPDTTVRSIPPEITPAIAPVVKDLKDDSTRHHNNIHSNLGSMASLSTSTMSVYSEIEDSYKAGIMVSGEIYFSLFYDETRKMLNIYVDQCRNIAVADKKRRRTDPYIKTYLLPDRTRMSKRKSTIKNKSLAPVFKESLSYNISRPELESRTLSVSVWHKSTILKYNLFLGEVQIALSGINLTSKECSWYALKEKRKYPARSSDLLSKGELSIKLKYKASNIKEGKGSLHVVIESAKHLEHDHNTVNAYVKGYLLPDKNTKSKRKTGISKGTSDHLWNFPMVFSDVTLKELRDRSLELSIYHQNLIKGNEFLGGVRLNLGLGLHSLEHVQWMDAQGDEKIAWEKLLSNQVDFVTANLRLRPNLDF